MKYLKHSCGLVVRLKKPGIMFTCDQCKTNKECVHGDAYQKGRYIDNIMPSCYRQLVKLNYGVDKHPNTTKHYQEHI